MITFHHANTPRLRIAHLCVLKQVSSTCHVSFLAAPDTDHQHKFSLPISSTSPIFPTVSPLQTSPMILDPYIPCDVPRQSGGSTQIPSLTGCEPKSVEFKNTDAEAIEPEDLEPRRIELDRNLGTDPYPLQERLYRNSLTEDMDEFGKVGAETSYIQSQMHSDYDSAESIADSDLKMENYEKCWLHHCIQEGERKVL